MTGIFQNVLGKPLESITRKKESMKNIYGIAYKTNGGKIVVNCSENNIEDLNNSLTRQDSIDNNSLHYGFKERATASRRGIQKKFGKNSQKKRLKNLSSL